ncbi:hypothetical protein MXB_4214, partial [Myxobolus squamalis]
GYVPTFDDILRCRKVTMGISEYHCFINKIPFTFIDVGGQRTQRRKWYSCFENATAVIFMVACSDFDKVISEDRTTNSITESLNILKSIITDKVFKKSTIIIDFNKLDLLMTKLKDVDIKNFLPDFSGNSRLLDDVKEYYINSFRS